MSWRLGNADYWRYARLCPECGLLRGWSTRQRTETHRRELEMSGLVVDATRVEEYIDGADGTCEHGASDPEPATKARAPIAKRRKKAIG